VSDAAGLVVLLGRILFSLFFGAVAGVGHIKARQMLVGVARSGGLPFPALGGWPAGLWLITASLSISLGIWPDVGALMIAAFVTIAASYFHRFWTIEDPQQRNVQNQLFFRNVIALGAALMMFGFFAAAGESLRYTITGPLFSF
jgi:uncharacterized membrane protein YphA (DoxX/SURF4 family)